MLGVKQDAAQGFRQLSPQRPVCVQGPSQDTLASCRLPLSELERPPLDTSDGLPVSPGSPVLG